jgi:hypothetical protein
LTALINNRHTYGFAAALFCSFSPVLFFAQYPRSCCWTSSILFLSPSDLSSFASASSSSSFCLLLLLLLLLLLVVMVLLLLLLVLLLLLLVLLLLAFYNFFLLPILMIQQPFSLDNKKSAFV